MDTTRSLNASAPILASSICPYNSAATHALDTAIASQRPFDHLSVNVPLTPSSWPQIAGGTLVNGAEPPIHPQEQRDSRRTRSRRARCSSSDRSTPSHTSHRRRKRSYQTKRRSASHRRGHRSRSSRWRSPSSISEMSSASSSPNSHLHRSRPPGDRNITMALSRTYSLHDAESAEISRRSTSRGTPLTPLESGAGVPPHIGDPPPAAGIGHTKPTVWVIGHSYIYWAEKRTKVRPGGRNMGFHNTYFNWRGIRGLRWPQVLMEVIEIGREATGPVILVIHAGGNDLGHYKSAELMAIMKLDTERFRAFFRKLTIVWSEIVPRTVWRGARDITAIERTKRLINIRMAKFVKEIGGVVIRHRELEGDGAGLIRPDGVHLTDSGLDIFLSGLQDGVEQALMMMDGGRSPAYKYAGSSVAWK
ncbi:uncharacterized protein [Phyllobates terribilis]|uniref:uncharacterized protein n=1 Tax=Phyllobates terribilis TaxID=111132 RepID=UPI003CCAC2F2